MPGAPDEPFDPFAGATVLLPSPPRVDPPAPPHPGEIPPPPDYNNLSTEGIAIADTDPNLRGTSNCRTGIGVIPRVGKGESRVRRL